MQSSNTTATAPPDFWWESLPDEVECPITLEPVNTLPYPPFVLRHKQQTQTQTHNDDHNSTDVQYFFDGHALASYIVSRAIFQNPLTRENLTYDDCRRLDQYLEEYCYHHHQGSNKHNNASTNTQKRFDVLEAFALRESVQVRTSGSTATHSLTQSQLENQRRRAEFLRSEATAALSGLFVYGTANQRNSSSHRGRGGRRTNNNNNTNGGRPANALAALQQQQSAPPLAFGFDLHRPIHDTSNNTVDEDFGMVVIDDDEAVAVEREQEAYQELQEAFPHLSTSTTTNNNTTEHEHTRSPRTQANLLAMNEEKLEQIRQQAERERIQEEQRQQRLQQAQQQLARQAQARREERKKEREALKAKAHVEHQKQQLEQQEVARARAEIEQWREEQWERLRHIAEREQAQRLEQERTQRALAEQQQKEQQQREMVANEATESKIDDHEEEDREANQKAAKAAKRKRAKERKKQEKAQERQEQQKKEKQAALEAKKKASSVKCAACQGGIVGVPFERFGHHFCSPKCARDGPSESND